MRTDVSDLVPVMVLRTLMAKQVTCCVVGNTVRSRWSLGILLLLYLLEPVLLLVPERRQLTLMLSFLCLEERSLRLDILLQLVVAASQ